MTTTPGTELSASPDAGSRVGRWWSAVRSVGRARLTYEIVLTVLLAASAALTAVVSGSVAWGVVVGVATVFLVPLRLVHPLSTLLAGAALGVFVADASSTYLWFVLSASAGYRAQPRLRTVATFVAAWGFWLVSLWRYPDMRDATGFVLASAAFILVAVLPGFIGWWVGRRRRLVRAMHWRNVQLHDQQTVVAREARARERTRIARDLHDSLGHQLTLISLYAGTLAGSSEQQREKAVELLRTTAADAMTELRQSIGVLRAAEDTDDVGVAQPLTHLDGLANAVRSTGAVFTVNRTGTPRPLPPLLEHAAYRVIQEGVTNALRHARGAVVQLTLRYEPDTVVVEVVNGRGLAHRGPTGGRGLIGLGERLRLAGGVLYHGPTPDGGFRLAAMLPYHAPHPHDGGQGAPQAGIDPAGGRAGGDFEAIMRRSARRSRGTVVVLATGLVAVLTVCGAALVLVAASPPTTVRPEDFHRAHIGQSEAAVRQMLPAPSAAVTDAVGATVPPPGASCVDYTASLAAQLEHDSDRDLVYRFCFKAGALVSKDAFANLTS